MQAIRHMIEWLCSLAIKTHAARAAKEIQHESLAANTKVKEAVLDQASALYERAEGAPPKLAAQYRKLADDLVEKASAIELEPGEGLTSIADVQPPAQLVLEPPRLVPGTRKSQRRLSSVK